MHESNTSEGQVAAFFSAAVAMFEDHPMLERYAFYPWNTYNHLVDEASGTLTAVGTAFAAAKAYKQSMSGRRVLVLGRQAHGGLSVHVKLTASWYLAVCRSRSAVISQDAPPAVRSRGGS